MYNVTDSMEKEFSEYKNNNRVEEYLYMLLTKLRNYFKDTEYIQAQSVLEYILESGAKDDKQSKISLSKKSTLKVTPEQMRDDTFLSTVDADMLYYEEAIAGAGCLIENMVHVYNRDEIGNFKYFTSLPKHLWNPCVEISDTLDDVEISGNELLRKPFLGPDGGISNTLADDMIEYLGVKNMDIDGNPYYYVSEGDMVTAIVYDEKHGSVILSSQKRPYNSYSVEPAGGKIDKGESPMSAIVREVEEELQLDLSKANIMFVSKVNCAPGLFTSMTYLYWISVQISNRL